MPLFQVGGFMGLLLGASILSVIEFFDYMILMCSSKRKQNATVADSSP